ncbi:enolase C-terminal domain-like protein [Microbacterium sp. NIBRBAC000506063]|uniref:enolase C-terminal domain-like protein n=1 Tax=Microbacterium sp. NIBRBAC000506063 TaxID=2734618 RepID=UPI002948C114|nr:enolase C-terminal domain-like protein [Microbacterium sp. NIBRBAC000506063]
MGPARQASRRPRARTARRGGARPDPRLRLGRRRRSRGGRRPHLRTAGGRPDRREDERLGTHEPERLGRRARRRRRPRRQRAGGARPDRDVAVDCHGRFTLATARRLAPLLEPLHPFFIEEPVVPENSHMIERMVDATTIPIAAGERLYSRQEFLPVFQAGIAIAQPDLSHAGGISETRRIAALAETFDALIAPHCPLGPLALASCLQLGFATPNHLIQEQSIGIHYNKGAEVLDYVLDTAPLRFVDGCFELLTGPGLGIEIDEKAVRDAASRWETWQNPVWRHADGSMAEW